MKTIGSAPRRARAGAAAVLAAAALVLSGCGLVGGGTSGQTPVMPTRSDDPIVGTTTPAPPTAATLDTNQAAVADALRAYNAALAVNDYNRACTLMVPEAQQALVDRVRERAAGAPIATCFEALTAVFTQEGATQAVIDTQSSTIVEDVTITGTDATVVWSSRRAGQLIQVENTLRLVDAQWLLVGTA